MSLSVGTAIGIVSAIAGFFGPKLAAIRAQRQARAQRLVIGLVSCDVPEPLSPYCDFTDYKKAMASGLKIVVVHCRSLSYALRKCDFVIADADKDEKIIRPDDIKDIQAILPKD